MASYACVALTLLFTISEITASQCQQHHNISLGRSLSPSRQPTSWPSSSGRFEFGFYKQGTGYSVGIWLVTSPVITIVWTANPDDPPVSSNATVTLTMDGELILRSEESADKFIAHTSTPASFASMLDSGNFVLCDKRSDIIWQSFSSPTDTILGGQNLYRGDELLSSISKSSGSTRRFRLQMQVDGNLVLYPASTINGPAEAYWSSNTWGAAGAKLCLSPTGVLQLMIGNETLKSLARSSYSFLDENETLIYRTTLDSDGILRLYSHHFRISNYSNVTNEWSALQNQCKVRGFCGLNSFCSNSINSSSIADCYCFPGFDFINPKMRSLGCSRNFSDDEGCERKKPEEYYRISNVDITKLGGFAYAKLTVNKTDCSKSCLTDCYCGAALYSSGSCNKFKLPLLFAMRDRNESDTLFIKWSSGKPKANRNTTRIAPALVADNKKELITVLAACLGSVTFLCFFVAISSLISYNLQVNRYEKLGRNSNLGLTQEFISRSFSYNELEQATNGFVEEVGRGRFGAVYKGAISDANKIIAIKRLENPVEEGERKFQAEFAAVRRIHHKNLVRLLGFCFQSSKKLLVYEFMNKGSLENLLFDVERRPTWRQRVRIALDVARGILYLHEECEVQIIHCDINPRNILLDDSWTAKISGFGLAKLLMPNQTGIVAGVRGTRGYVAPEWQSSGLITVKSDVYSFGFVLLEIVCCRSNLEVNVSSADEVLLSSWVYKCFVAQELHKLVAEEEEVDMRALERMVKVGLLCIQDEPTLRPTMKNVILMLEGALEIPVPPFPPLFKS